MLRIVFCSKLGLRSPARLSSTRIDAAAQGNVVFIFSCSAASILISLGGSLIHYRADIHKQDQDAFPLVITEMKYHKESAWEFRRRRAIELMEQGEKWTVIAHVLGVSQQSLYNWYKKHQAGDSLIAKSFSGRPPKLSPNQLEILRELLMQGAKAHGWPNDLWTGKRVAKVIRDRFGVDFSHNYVQALLRNSLNWTVQRPVQHVNEPNEGSTKQWLKVELPRIITEAQRTNSHIVFIDEAGFMLAPLIRQTFAPRGKTPVIQVSDLHSRISIAGALTVSPKQKHLGFLYRLLPDNINFHGDSTADFVRQILLRIPGPITIIWDGFSIHSSEPVRQYLEQHRRVTVEQFPACAPELNPVDKVWFYLKYDRLPNFAPVGLDELRKRLLEELRALHNKSNVLFWCVRQTGLDVALLRNQSSLVVMAA